MLTGTLSPAYGRDYKSKAEAIKDWNEGKDFQISNVFQSTYCSIRDAEANPAGSKLQIRWKRLTQVAVITKKEDGTWK